MFLQLNLKRVSEAVDLLKQLKINEIEDIDKSALTWYYALCMDFLLEAAIFIESFETCENFALKLLGSYEIA